MKADSLNLQSLIRSKNGVHVSIYIPQPSSELSFKHYLEAALAKCSSQMRESLNEDAISLILGPIESLLRNPKMISGFNSNIGIFRTDDFLRLISLPVATPFSVHVADTFHVKPLLTYLNLDYQYLFYGSDGQKAYLYKGTKKSYQLVEEFHFQDDRFFENDPKFKSLGSDAKKKKYMLETNIAWVEQVIAAIDKKNSHSIFISANAMETRALRKALKHRQLYWRNVSRKFSISAEKSTMRTIQNTLDIEKTISLNLSLNEFENPAVRRLVKTRLSYDINEISMAAKQGKVSKLLVASDAYVFGKLNDINGEVMIREADMDHTDDDLLDDIAQNVFKAGGEVMVVEKKSMPKGELIVGALRDSPSPQKMDLNKHLISA